jgi:alpha-L-rhamnosidase
MKKLLITIIAVCFYGTCLPQGKGPETPNCFQSSLIKPENIIQKEPGHFFIDFGKDAFGTLSLLFKSPQKDSLIIHLGEKLTDKYTIDRNPGGTIRYQKVTLNNITTNKQFLLTLAHNTKNEHYPAITLPDTFGVVFPFRYCEIENLNMPITDVVVLQKVFNYKFNDEASAFYCSDSVLNKIWDMCKHTIKVTSFCGYYIDGDRERTPYEADALINQLSHYCVDNEYTLAQRTSEYFINHPTWPTEWILQTTILFYYDYLYTGNTALVSKYYEDLKNKTLTRLEGTDGLITTKSSALTDELMKSIGFTNTQKKISDIVDWPLAERDNYEMVDVNTVVNCFYYMNLKVMYDIAKVLGKNEDADYFLNKSVKVRNTINDKLFNPITGIYIDGIGSRHSSLHANMFPLAFGIVPDGYKNKVIKFIKTRGMACSVYGAQYLLEAMYLSGEQDYALNLMNSTEGNRNWWNMIKEGSTVTLEAWDIKYKPNLDWNHAWGAAPANIITRYMWGIKPLKPAFKRITIKPQLSNLTFSKIKVPTIKGAVTAEFKKTGSKKKLFIIQLPAGMEGEFIVPDSNTGKILFNNKLIESGSAILQITAGINQIEIE